MTDFRIEAEKHWEFIEALLKHVPEICNLEIAKFLYVEAMIHGFKHGVTFRTKETEKQK